MRYKPDHENSNNWHWHWLFYNIKRSSILKLNVDDYVKRSVLRILQDLLKDENEIHANGSSVFTCFLTTNNCSFCGHVLKEFCLSHFFLEISYISIAMNFISTKQNNFFYHILTSRKFQLLVCFPYN